MDLMGYLIVRFHFDGEFINAGRKLHFCGGKDAIAHIDRDKVSLPEVVGHLKDHCSSVNEGTLLHWLYPGKELHNGLRALVDDNACMDMNNRIDDGCVAEVYVEQPSGADETDDEGSDYENEMVLKSDSEEEEDKDLGSGGQLVKHHDSRDKAENSIVLKEFYSHRKTNSTLVQGTSKGAENSSSDSEYLPGDISTSEDDEEAKEILKKFREFKKKVKSGVSAHLDDVFVEAPSRQSGDFLVISDGGYQTTYSNTSDDGCESYDDMDNGEGDELHTKENKFSRFSNKDPIPMFSLGMKFTGKKQFKKAMIKYALAERKVIKFVKDEGDRVRVKCQWPTCSWVCLLSTKSNTTSWQITTLNNDHTCPPRRDNSMVTSRRIAEKYEKMIRANPTWNLESMKATVQEEMFADVSISKLKRAKSIVMQKILDATKGQYQRLFDYQLELLRSNPGSTVIVKLDPNEEKPIFQRMYICLAACKLGFQAGCRRVVGLDGCFFKGATHGELLCAVGRDGNNQMYPIAWAVVEKENNDSWDWICDILFRDIKVQGGDGWVFISDQQKGIINAISKWAPEAEHRNCARHVYANWRKKFKKEWQKRWWKCAKAPCQILFNRAIARLAQFTRQGSQAALNSNPHHWSRSWFKLGSNCDSVDNNICESFNKWIVEARFYPIITMLEMIRKKVMVRIQEMNSKADRWITQVCPNILRKLNTFITQSGTCHAIYSGADKYEVEHYDNRWTVNLVDKTCSCRYWQLSGLPCPHAISCIFMKTNSLDDYTAACYRVDAVKATYSYFLQPVEGMNNWPVSDRVKPLAPGYVKMPGRPKKERRRETTEKPKPTKLSRVGTRIRCRICKGLGHNRSSCAKRNGTAPSASVSAPAAHATREAPCGTPSALAHGTNASPNAPSVAASLNATSVAASPNAMVVVSSTQQSCSNAQVVESNSKRKSTAEV